VTLQDDCLYSEQETLARVAEGDQRAFTLIVEQYTAAIYAHVLTYIKNAFRAEEITQDIFVNVWKHRTDLPGIANFPGYLYVMTRNRAISAFREKIFHPEPEKDELETDGLNPAGALEFRQFSETVMRGIASLPPRRKQVFTMSRFEGMSYEEIARRLEISKSAVNQHIVEALLFLRTFLRNEMTFITAFLPAAGILATYFF
jgi:RNA polymerase sigma-70 factor (family 1)